MSREARRKKYFRGQRKHTSTKLLEPKNTLKLKSYLQRMVSIAKLSCCLANFDWASACLNELEFVGVDFLQYFALRCPSRPSISSKRRQDDSLQQTNNPLRNSGQCSKMLHRKPEYTTEVVAHSAGLWQSYHRGLQP